MDPPLLQGQDFRIFLFQMFSSQSWVAEKMAQKEIERDHSSVARTSLVVYGAKSTGLDWKRVHVFIKFKINLIFFSLFSLAKHIKKLQINNLRKKVRFLREFVFDSWRIIYVVIALLVSFVGGDDTIAFLHNNDVCSVGIVSRKKGRKKESSKHTLVWGFEPETSSHLLCRSRLIYHGFCISSCLSLNLL